MIIQRRIARVTNSESEIEMWIISSSHALLSTIAQLY